jgi:hypothetical protein
VLLSGKGGDLSTVPSGHGRPAAFHRPSTKRVQDPARHHEIYGEVATSPRFGELVACPWRDAPQSLQSSRPVRCFAAGGKAEVSHHAGGVDTKKLNARDRGRDDRSPGSLPPRRRARKASPKSSVLQQKNCCKPGREGVFETRGENSEARRREGEREGVPCRRRKFQRSPAALKTVAKAPARCRWRKSGVESVVTKPAAAGRFSAPVATRSAVSTDFIFDSRKAVAGLIQRDATLARLIDTVGPLRLDIK